MRDGFPESMSQEIAASSSQSDLLVLLSIDSRTLEDWGFEKQSEKTPMVSAEQLHQAEQLIVKAHFTPKDVSSTQGKYPVSGHQLLSGMGDEFVSEALYSSLLNGAKEFQSTLPSL
jgi:hypothetical protein